MAIFYYNATGPQGNADGSSAADASGSLTAAIDALASGDGVEVTAGTFTLTAAQASGSVITGVGAVVVTAIADSLTADLSQITVSGARTLDYPAALTGFAGNLGSFTVNIDSSGTGGSVAASVLTSVDAQTSGQVNAGTASLLTGTAAEIATAISASTIDTATNVAVTVSAGTAAASDLNTIDSNTTAVVNAVAVTTITGTAAAVQTAITAATIDTAVTVAATVDSGTATVAQVNAIDAATTGVVTATISQGDLSTLATLTGTGNAYTITVTDSSAAASALTTLDAKTTVAVNADQVTTMTGMAAAVNAAYSASSAGTITGLGGEAVTLSDTTLAASDLNTVNSNTSGTVNAGSVTTLTGLLVDVNAAYAAGSAGQISGLGDETVTITNAAGGTLLATDLSTAGAATSGTVTVSNAQTVTGTDSELTAALVTAASRVVMGSPSSATVSNATNASIGAAIATTSNITASFTAGLQDSLANLASAGVASANLTSITADQPAVVITINDAAGGTMAAADLSAVGGATTGAVSISNPQTINGSADQITAAVVTASSRVTPDSGSTLNASGYTNQDLSGVASSFTLNVTTATGAVLDASKLVTADAITIGAGSATIDAASTDEVALAAKTTVNNGTTLTVNNYVNTDLSGLSNQGSGSIVVNTTTGAVLDETKLADATSVVLGAAASGAASAIDGIGTNGSRINLNNQTLSVSGYTTEDLSGITSTGTLNITTVTGAVLDAAKLAYADAITVVGTNSATAADADTLGSRLSGTATVNITTDPISANTDLSDLGSGLTLQFGGDSTVAVNGATLTVRQNQVSGYTISGTGTVAATGTAAADTFDASGFTATLNITSLAGADSIIVSPSALDSADTIQGGADTDTLIFSAAGSGVVDLAFTNLSSVEILQLANGTNSVTLGAEAEAAGITTVTGGTGADTINLLYGSTALSFNAGSGIDTLSYSADSASQSITLSSISTGSASGTTVSNSITDSFSGLEVIAGGSGSSDTITSTATGETLVITGANSGTIDGFAFSGVESVDLVGGSDTATLNGGGSLSGNLSFGTGTDTLNYGSYGSAVSVTLSTITSGSGTTSSGGATGFGGVVSGVESITGSTASDTLTDSTGTSTIAITGANSGTLDSLSFSGFENLALSTGDDTVTVSSGASLAGDLNLGDGTNSLTLNAGAGAIGSVTATSGTDTVTISGGSVTGAVNLGDGINQLTISGSTASIGSYTGGTGNDTLTLSGGDVTGNADLGSGTNTLAISSTSSTIGGTVSFGSGTSDTLTYAGYGSVVSVTLNGSNGTAASGATAISGAISGLDSLAGSSNSDSLTGSSSDNTLVLTGANQGTLDGALGFSSFESVNLATGNDNAQFTSGDSLSGTLAGGTGSDTLDYSAYGSAVTVNLATGTATGTGAISGFESVLGSSSGDTITASSSGDVNLQGNGGNDTFNVTIAGLTSGDSIDGGIGNDQLVFSDAGTISDGQFTNVTLVESVTLTGASSLSAGTEASQAGIASVVTGAGNTTINSTLDGYDLTVNATSLADASSLTLSGSASSNDFTVNSLTGSVLAGGTSGMLTVTSGNATDNAIGVTTGSGATSIIANGSGDTVTTNATNLGQNTLLSLSGSAKQVVTNLVGNLSASSLSGTLDVTTADAGDNGISITTGSNDTTITGSGSGDTVTVDADVMADNKTLDINGSATYVVSNLEANSDAAGSSGSVSLAFTDVTDNAATITTGSGATTVSGTTSGDTLTINAAALAQNTTLTQSGAAQQVVNNLVGDISASGLSGTLTVTTGDATDNGISISTGSAATLITGTSATDTLTVDATQLTNNTNLTLQGASAVVVNGLSGDLRASNSLSYSENFSSGATGWINGTVESSNAYYGSFLGRYASGPKTSGQDTYKTFSLDGQQATLSFDFLRLDSWDNESFSVYINDVSAFTGTFQHGAAISTASGSTNGFSWTIAPKDSLANRGFVSNWDDQAATITIAIPTGNANVKVGFGSSLNSSIDDESYGIDNLVLNASSLLSGPLTVTTADNTVDNGTSLTTGSASTTINASGSGDTVTVNADAMVDNTTLDINGSATFTVSNLEANTDAAGSTGLVTLAYSDVTDNAASISTGAGATTITSGSSGDTLSINADALLDNTTLALNGSATYTVTNLEGNLDASGTSGSLSVGYSNVSDNSASLTTGSGNVVVSGGDASDTITVTGPSTGNQTFSAQASSANFLITAGADSQTITGSNTGSDTVAGGGGTDTLSYAGGSAVTVTVTDYGTQAGGSTGQGSDSFSNIESLVGSGGTDTLQGRTTATDESVTITGANSGTISDSPSTGTFSFSSFEQLDLQGGNDTLTITGSDAGVSLSSSADLGSGNNTFTMSGSAGSIASLSAGSGSDSFSLSAGSITGALAAGDGSNTLTVSGTSSSVGSYTGGSGTDTITLSGGDLGGNVDVGSGSNTLTLSSTSSTITGNVSFGAGSADTLSYAGYSNAVSVDLSAISSNAGSTSSGGATAISGTVAGFETLVGGSSSADSVTDSSGDSTIAITGADSGTIDGLAFSSIENLNLSTGNDTVTVTGSGSGVSLTGSLDLGDGTNSLGMSGSAGSIASVSSGTGDDTMTISAGSVTGAVNAGDGGNTLTISGTSSSIGSYSGGSGTDSITLSGGDVVGNVSTTTGSDTVLISSTSSTIGGNLDLGGGTGDTLSYAGYVNAVSVTLTDISSNAGSTAAGGATAISGTSTGFENLVGGSNSGDTVTDSTGDSTIVISGANSGTIDGLAFSAIENLTLSSGIDGVTVQSGGSLFGTLNLGGGTGNTVQMDSGAGSIGVLTADAGNDTVTLDGGSVSGAVNLGNGTNALTINHTASSIGSYSGGSGADTIVSKGGDINGTINTSSAADSLTLTLGAVVSGSVTLGADSTAADGADVLSLNASSITGSVTTGSGSDSVSLSAGSSVTGTVSLGIDGDSNGGGSADTLTLDASSITGNVTTGSGADSVSVLNASTITGNVTLGSNSDTADGADTLTVTGASSSSQSVITGSLATGAGADAVSFTNATIGGSGQTISLGSDSNSLEGNDTLSASASTLTANISTGTGSDTLTLSAGSVLTGDVTLGSIGDITTITDASSAIIDSFDSLSGWIGGTRDSSSAYYGSFLGRYASGAKTNGQDVYKSFSLNSQPATISFDLIKLDSWDGESFRAYVNDTPAFSANFSASQAISASSGTTNGFSWTITPKDSFAGHGFAGWADQTATITIALPAGYSNLKLGFGSTLDQGIDDESYGIDNLAITSSILSNNDTLTLNASSLTGNVVTGSAADSVSVLNASTITGNVTLGSDSDSTDGGDTLTVTGASISNRSVVAGSIATGAGADLVTLSNATIGGAGQTLSLGSDSNGNDGDDSLNASGSAITATVTTGSGDDSISLSSGSTVTGTITLGIDADADDGTDTLTLTGASGIDGAVAFGSGDDTLNLSAGISSPTAIEGTVNFGSGSGDTLSYAGNAGPITVAINSDSAGTASSADASYITGDVSGFEFIIGSDEDAATLGAAVDAASVGDTIYDNTSNSLVILTGANQGTIEDIDFSSIENLQLRAGSDTVSFRGFAGSPGLIAGLADGGGTEGASYANGVYTGGSYSDTSVDLLDYTQYLAGGVDVDLSRNRATGVFAGEAGGLVSGDGTIEVATQDSSFENVDGSSFGDTIVGDDQDSQGNLLRGFGGADLILGLAGGDTIDGGDGTSGADGADTIAAGDGDDLILGSDGSDLISGGGYAMEDGFQAVEDGDVDTLSYIDENEGLDLSLDGADAGTVKADATATLFISSFTGTYSGSGAQTISVPTNQTGGTDWSDTYGDIQRLVLSNQNDILRIDRDDVISISNPGGPSGDGSFSVNAGAGTLDTLDYSSFASSSPVYVNLSNSSYSFDFDANGVIDETAGEITIENSYSATNINVDPGLILLQSTTDSTADGAGANSGTPAGPVVVESAFGGQYGVNSFEVVIGGAADDAIVGNESANLLAGNAGADRIAGQGGGDTIYGGKGDDYLIPGEGADLVNGGEGINTILITSSDLANDTFAVDPNGINIFKLNGDGSTTTSEIDAPSGSWNPGAQGIDLLDGGDPEEDSAGNTVYDTVNGTATNDDYQFAGTAFKNISDVNLGAGDDSVGTAPTSKGIKVSYDGESGEDNITLTLTFQQFARLNQSGLYVADVQNYIDDPSGKTFTSNQADLTATNFESGGVQVITPAVYNALQGDPAALIFNTSVGLQGVSASNGDDLALAATATTSSTATARSTADLVSAFVQANIVKGADAVSLSSGAGLSGTASADQTASASAITVDDRSDSVLSAYGLGADRSNLAAGGDINLSLSGGVNADTLAQAVSGVVNASATGEAAGSRDTSLSAGADLDSRISGNLNQIVAAGTVDGLAVAGLASRTYGIDDANLTDASADSLQAGGDLTLDVSATDNSQVSARSIGTQSLGPITLVDNGVASTDRFTLPSSLWGAAFPLINGDRLRLASTPAGSSLEADRDYYVLNVIPVTGEFQLSSTPAGDPIDVLLADSGTALEAFRPAVATADAISTVVAVDLNRSGIGQGGLQAGAELTLEANATDVIRATASSVVGDATAGLNRLGGLDNLDVAPVSSVVSLAGTASFSGSDAAIQALAGEAATLQATSADGAALAEGNVQVLGLDSSTSSAGADLNLSSSANLSLVAEASSTSGRAEARSGAGAGSGSSTASPVGAVSGNALPEDSTYGLAVAVRDGGQSAAADLSLNASATLDLQASARSGGGAATLSSLWSDAGGTVLSTFDPTASTPSLIGPQYLADGQPVRLDAANATALGLDAASPYVVRLLASTGVDATGDTITMPADITYSDGDAIRFRLNSTTPANGSASRYGLELGTTYYVVGSSGSTFQLATAPGGAVIDLTADPTGLDDQLVDSDRFQLLVPPATPGAPYTVASLTPGASGLSVQLPSDSVAFAGSRQAGITLADPTSLDLAEVSGIDGRGLAAAGGVLSLLSGAGATISAAADGVLNALARNTASDATASGGLLATGLQDVAVTAGGESSLSARATINAVAEASTSGDSATLDNSLSSLNLTARGIDAGEADQDIRLGADGAVTVNASIDARSTARLVSGGADALGSFEATALRADDAGINVTIAQVGDLTASARLGSSAAPVLMTALSSGAGDASAQGAAQVEGILGSYAVGSSPFSGVQVGAAQGDIRSSASASIQIQASANDGVATASLADVSGVGPVVVSGIRDMALNAGAAFSRIDASANGSYAIAANSVSDDALASSITLTQGILSDTAAPLPVSFAQNGAIAALVNDVTIARAVSVAGDASSDLRATSLGLSNASISVGGTADLSIQALSRSTNQAQSVIGNVSA